MFKVGDYVKFNNTYLQLEEIEDNFNIRDNYARIISISGKGYLTKLTIEWQFELKNLPKITQTFPAICFRLMGNSENNG